MQFEESQQSRQLMGSLDRGEELVAQLDRIADLQQIKAGALRGVGTIHDVELVRRNHATGEWVTVVDTEGPFDIVQLTAHMASLGGQPAIRIEALLNAQGPGGPQLVFGQIRRAKVIEFEFTLETFDDLVAERRLDHGMLILAEVRQTGNDVKPVRERKPVERIAEPKLGKAEPAPTPVVTPSTQTKTPEADEPAESDFSWGDAVKAAQEIKPAPARDKPSLRRPPRASDADDKDDEDDHTLMEPGDILDHPKLGRCRVIKVEEDEFAHIRLERGSIRKLALEVCEIRHVGEEGGRNVFQVRIKR
ncbi:MAG: DUF296 domain-containing protein [bacterium]